MRDIQANSNIWADVALADYFPDATNAWAPLGTLLLSANGRFVVFEAAETVTFRPVVTLRYDILTGSTRLISVLTNYSYPFLPGLSEDGRFVLLNGPAGPFVFDAELGVEELVCPAGRFPGLNACKEAVLSADGSRVAFLGAASTNGPWSVYVAQRGQGAPVLASVTTNGTPAEVVPLLAPAFSRDGTKVAFESEASDLVPSDFNQAADIFVRDLAGDSTRLVSARAEGMPMGASLQPSVVFTPQCLSSDGRYLVFNSLHNQLASGDYPNWMNAFLQDNLAGTNTLLPLLATAGPGSVAGGMKPVLSLNGRYVAWLEPLITNTAAGWAASSISWLDRETGAARNIPLEVPQAGAPPAMSQDGRWLALVAPVAQNSFLQVFLQDMWETNSTRQLVSANRDGQSSAGHSTNPRFSPNGRWLLFDSQSHDLATNTLAQTPSHLYARDIFTGKTRHLGDSWFPGGTESQASNAVFSADSRYVVFLMPRPSGGFFVRQALEGPTNQTVLCTHCSQPSVSQDGRFVAFRAKSPTTGYQEIFVWDAQTSNSVLITTNVLPGALASADGNSSSPQLTPDGRYVCFASEAGNLVSLDSNRVADVFVHDRTLRRTFLISRRLGSAASGSGASSQPVLGPDGRTIVFASFAGDLVANDFNATRDLYLVQLGHGDSDTDGLDDDWELAYFNIVSRDGKGDFDADGATDLEEFRSGTDPTNHASVLQVLTVRSLQTNRKLILWASTPGRTYRVQFKRAVTDPQWTDLPGAVLATADTASTEDSSSVDEPERFYRVMLVD